MRLVVGICGASGAIYGVRLLEVLKETQGVETHLVVTEAAEKTIKMETDRSLPEVKALADYCYQQQDIGAPIASGSFKADGMAIIPCSMKTLAGLASAFSDNLLLRAADVTLKERRPLVIVPRETPLHAIHLRHMLTLSKMGVTIMVPSPAFYFKPKTVAEIADFVVDKTLAVFGINCNLFKHWDGMKEE